MSRAELLRDIEAIVSGAGFELSSSENPMTFRGMRANGAKTYAKR
jgi:hypothetical protein